MMNDWRMKSRKVMIEFLNANITVFKQQRTERQVSEVAALADEMQAKLDASKDNEMETLHSVRESTGILLKSHGAF